MLDGKLIEHVRCSGFKAVAEIVHLFIGGSELHGAKIGTTDDLDIYGVFVEPPEIALGLTPWTHFVWSTAGDERRNGPDDVDITLYSLRRWAQLAAKGNATALHFVFAGATAISSPIWNQVQEHRAVFLSKQSAKQFVGFADNQKQRITGEKGRGAKGQRPEYIGKFGYDTKAAMHCLRLYLECIELMEFGTITLPSPETDYLIDVRTGNWPLERFLEEAHALHGKAINAAQTSSLPETIDVAAINRVVTEAHICHWEFTRSGERANAQPQAG